MSEKVKILNYQNYPIGMVLHDGIRELVVEPKRNGVAGFTFLSIDELTYQDNIGRLFKDGHLVIESNEVKEELGHTDNPNLITDEEISKIFAMNINEMKKELKNITAKHARDKVIEIAIAQDLSQSKLKAIGDIFNVNILADLALGDS